MTNAIELADRHRPGAAEGPAAFVENKIPDFRAIAKLMEPAIIENRYTNFGPVAASLQAELFRLNCLPNDRAVCVATNCTIALQAAMAAVHDLMGRQLRWAVSGFSFFTSYIGYCTNQTVVDCGCDGVLSVDQLVALESDQYDGVILTNVFGFAEDFQPIFSFCRERNKALIIDNAAGLGALATYHAAHSAEDPLLWCEVVSFHSTKPWGIGEGGAVFLPNSLSSAFESAINFGSNGLCSDLELCTNGKMSELAAAQILWRVNSAPLWVPEYRTQAARILQLGKNAGLTPLFDQVPSRAVVGNIPFLSSRPLTPRQLDNPTVVLQKYYLPGEKSGPVARRLYDFIVNIPCHRHMADIDDAALLDVMRSFV